MFRIEPCTRDGQPALRLEEELTIYAVTEARDQLIAALHGQPLLQLDLSGLAELDTAGVQLLVWLKQEARRRGKGLQLFAHSRAVLEVFDLLQVAALLGDPILIAPSVS
jgi:anti-anti-sigma factor